MTLSEIDVLTRQVGTSLYNVNITGGEPFLRDDIFEIVRCYIVNAGVRSVVITTNGWFLAAIDDFIERFLRLDASCSVTISISIDNFEKEHDRGRKLAGLYARAMESFRLVEACRDPRVSATIAITVTPENCDTVVPLFRYLTGTGVRSLFPVLLREEGVVRHVPSRAKVVAAYETLHLLCVEQAKLVARGGESSRLAVYRAKNRVMVPLITSVARTGRSRTPCNAAALFGTVASNGDVYPCEVLGDSCRLGNLREEKGGLMALWAGATADRVRDKIVASRCCCTFECAWTVNILASPVYWPQLAWHTLGELL